MPAGGHAKTIITLDAKGFTLIELVASLVLLGILVAVFGLGLVGTLQNYNFNRTNVHLTLKAQIAMTRMARELRELVPFYDMSEGVNGIAVGATYIIYERSVDAPQPGQAPQVRYALVYTPATAQVLLYTGLAPGVNTLGELPSGAGDILIDQVQSFSLSYFQGTAAWTQAAGIRQLSAIRISMTLQRDDDASRGEDFSTLVYPRNLGSTAGATL